MSFFRSSSVLPLLGVLAAIQGSPAKAQVLSITPTFQASTGSYDPDLPGSRFRAYGIMVGGQRPGAWWSPHFWFQRYRISSDRAGANPDEFRSGTNGWMLTVGPGIEFLQSVRWKGMVLPQLSFEVGGNRNGDLKGGGDVHLAYRGGFFYPQFFAGFQNLGRGWFTSVGVGVSVDIIWEGAGRRH